LGRGSNLFRSKTTFTLQMKIARIMVAAKPRHSCKSLFEREILPIPGNSKFSYETSWYITKAIFTKIQKYTILIYGLSSRPIVKVSRFQKTVLALK